MTACPCQSERTYDACCGALHRGVRQASTAVELMRGRYAAFVKAEIEYLRTTHDPETRDEFDAESAREWATQADWERFEVVATEGGGPADVTGTVEFIAHYSVQGSPIEHHERSEFRRDGDVWYFRDGKEIPVTVRRDNPKVGRNDPCPCGSGKKLKKCCGRA